MPFIRLGVLAALIFCVASAGPSLAQDIPYDPLTMDFPVSPSQAMSAVRDLVGDPEMNLHIRDVSLPDDFSSDLDYWIDEVNGDHCFAVGAEDGWVSSWFNRIAQRQLGEHETESDPSSQLPEPVLVAMAEAFAAAHYPDFTGLNMQQPYPGYFSWVGRLSANVWNLSAVCMVGVDRWTGEAHTFLRRKPLPVTISTTPLISGASAEDIALDYLLQQPDVRTAFVLDNNGYCWVHHDSLGGQRLVYEIVFVTHGDADYTPAMYVAELEVPNRSPQFCWWRRLTHSRASRWGRMTTLLLAVWGRMARRRSCARAYARRIRQGRWGRRSRPRRPCVWPLRTGQWVVCTHPCCWTGRLTCMSATLPR